MPDDRQRTRRRRDRLRWPETIATTALIMGLIVLVTSVAPDIPTWAGVLICAAGGFAIYWLALLLARRNARTR